MIDIHNHILPNIDDGPTNETEMMDLLKQATTQGVTEIIVTSHHLHPRYTTPIEKVKSCLKPYWKLRGSTSTKSKVLLWSGNKNYRSNP